MGFLLQVSVVIQQVISKQPRVPVLSPLRATAVDQDLVQVISSLSLGKDTPSTTPGHSLMIIDLQKLQSDTDSSQVSGMFELLNTVFNLKLIHNL